MYCIAAAIAFVFAAPHPQAVTAMAGITAVSGSVGIALTTNVTVFGISVVVASAGAGFASPAMVALVQRDIPSARQNKVQAIVNAGSGPGLIIA